MDTQSFETAMRRARKRYAHAVRQQAEATSARAQHRHARRALNARRAMGDALWTFDRMAYAHDSEGEA